MRVCDAGLDDGVAGVVSAALAGAGEAGVGVSEPQPPVAVSNYRCGTCGQLLEVRFTPGFVRVVEARCAACAQVWSIFLADAVAAEAVCAGRRGEVESVAKDEANEAKNSE